MNDKNGAVKVAIVSVISTLAIVIVAAMIFFNGKNDNGNPKENNEMEMPWGKSGSEAANVEETYKEMYIANVDVAADLRSKPDKNGGEVIVSIPVGSKVLYIEDVDNVFSKVSYDEKTGYVERDYLSNEKYDPDEETDEVEEVPVPAKPVPAKPVPAKPQVNSGNTTIVKYMYVANVQNSIYLRSSANENSGNIITTIPLGELVGFIEYANNTFSKISYNGTIGYAKTMYLSDYYSAPNTTIVKYMYVANVQNSIYLRSSAYENSSNIITTIPLGAKVGFIEYVNNSFSKISYNGTIGYAKTMYLSDYYYGGSSSGSTYMTVCNVQYSIYLRSAPSENSNNIICEIPVGTVVTYLGNAGGGFYKISYNGTIGYSKSSYLR